jgi:hypothetical protein
VTGIDPWNAGAATRHNGELMLIDEDGPADDGWVGVEVRAPVAIADDGDGKLARSVGIFGGQKEPANFRLDAENGEEVAGDEFAPHAFGMVFFAYAEAEGYA